MLCTLFLEARIIIAVVTGESCNRLESSNGVIRLCPLVMHCPLCPLHEEGRCVVIFLSRNATSSVEHCCSEVSALLSRGGRAYSYGNYSENRRRNVVRNSLDTMPRLIDRSEKKVHGMKSNQ